VGELGKSPYLSVLSDARMGQTLNRMVRPADTKFSPEVASTICERTESTAAVEGSITGLGSEYVLGLRARNCRRGETLDQEQASAGAKENVFKALGQMANRFQNRAGESLARISREPTLPLELTTPSLEAWRSYWAAWLSVIRGSKHTEAISLAKRAVESDPKFAMAYALMVHCHCSEVIPFANTGIPLQPMHHMAPLLAKACRCLSFGKTGGETNKFIGTPALGKAVAEAFDGKSAVLMRGHGAAIAATSLHLVVAMSYYLSLNAQLQYQAIQLGGNKVTYLERKNPRWPSRITNAPGIIGSISSVGNERSTAVPQLPAKHRILKVATGYAMIQTQPGDLPANSTD
jgi:hypothetical protein